MKKKIIVIISLLIIGMIALVMPVSAAVANPDAISFGSGDAGKYKVFENVLEDSDMLFIAEGLVAYNSTPSYDADELFLFEVTNAAGTEIYLATSLNEYGDRPISIYQTAAQVTSKGLVSGTSYGLRIRGNPLIFATGAGNTANVTLIDTDWIDYSVFDNDENNGMRTFLLEMAGNIEDYDTPAIDYIENIDGLDYLSARKNPLTSGYVSVSENTTAVSVSGGSENVTEYSGATTTVTYTYSSSLISGVDIFMEGIPGISNMCPILLASGTTAMASDAPDSSGTYGDSLTSLAAWGAITDNGITQIGNYLDISHDMAAGLILFILAAALGIWIYKRTESGLATLLVLVGAVPIFGVIFGMLDMALMAIGVILVVILFAFYFYNRGAL